MAAFFFALSGAGWQWGQTLTSDSAIYREATTACLTAIVLMQVVNVHLCQSRAGSIFSRPLFSNRLITWGIAVEILIILLIDYTALGHTLFGTAPIGWRTWLFVLPFMIGMLVLEEMRKAIVRMPTRAQSEQRPQRRFSAENAEVLRYAEGRHPSGGRATRGMDRERPRE
jgi:magnesium-transporting ATPase (P-type)